MVFMLWLELLKYIHMCVREETCQIIYQHQNGTKHELIKKEIHGCKYQGWGLDMVKHIGTCTQKQ